MPFAIDSKVFRVIRVIIELWIVLLWALVQLILVQVICKNLHAKKKTLLITFSSHTVIGLNQKKKTHVFMFPITLHISAWSALIRDTCLHLTILYDKFVFIFGYCKVFTRIYDLLHTNSKSFDCRYSTSKVNSRLNLLFEFSYVNTSFSCLEHCIRFWLFKLVQKLFMSFLDFIFINLFFVPPIRFELYTRLFICIFSFKK